MIAALLLGLGSAVVFLVVVGVVSLFAPFVAQILDDHLRATERQRRRLRLTGAGGTVRQ